MKVFIALTLALLTITGCSSWGGYIHESSRYNFKFTFPVGWEIWDKSDDRRDFLTGTYKNLPDTKIDMTATPIAPDIEPTEIYPFFLEGSGDAAELLEFSIEDKGLVSASNGEGRFVKVKWKGEKVNMRGYRAIFLGNRFKLEVRAEMPEDKFSEQEAEFSRMIKELKL